MGNKLCAPVWKKSNYEASPWSVRKDQVLRLCCQIMHKMAREKDWKYWTTEIVSISIKLIQDGPQTQYQITAHKGNMETVLNIYIHQPGTPIVQPTEYFVHWTDPNAIEWGFKFNTSSDTSEFVDYVSRTVPRLERRKSWGSFKLRPSKRWARKSVAKASEKDDMDFYGFTPSKSPVESFATLPRQRTQPNTRPTVLSPSKANRREMGTGSLREISRKERAKISEVQQNSSFSSTLKNTIKETNGKHDDWPTPPEPITPITGPSVPDMSSSFDSVTLKKMLGTFPQQEPRTASRQGRSPTKRYTSPVPTASPSDPDTIAVTETSNRLLMEYEMLMRRTCTQEANYPDSGFGGTVSETAGSAKSGGSSQKSSQKSDVTYLPDCGFASSVIGESISGSSGTKTESFGTSSQYQDSVDGKTISQIYESDADSSSSVYTMFTEAQGGASQRTGATRKAGWLVVKNWLIHKKRKIELASKRSWKKYWVCLKGVTLYFYNLDEDNPIALTDDQLPKHMLGIEGGIAQAVPEHPKRENIFALSSLSGDAYLFEAPSQTELENWISALHSACASLYARQHGKDNTLRLLKSEIQKLENNIEIDIKMKKMAYLQSSVVSDTRSKVAISRQIMQWEENLEKLYIEQYRMRCYVSSLQGTELPNPKTLLTNVSKPTKATLGRLGVFTVTSVHALVCTRQPNNVNSSNTKNKKKLFSTFRNEIESKTPVNSIDCESEQIQILDEEESMSNNTVQSLRNANDGTGRGLIGAMSLPDNSKARVLLPNNQSVVISINDSMTIQDVVEAICNKKQLITTDHFIRMKEPDTIRYWAPNKMDLLHKLLYDKIEIIPKLIFQVELRKTEDIIDFGLSVEAELADDSERDDELCVFVSTVSNNSEAERKGLIVGDQLMVINWKVVAELDMVYVESMLQSCDVLYLTVRSCRIDQSRTVSTLKHVEVHIDSMMCPPPPSQSRLKDDAIDDLIVPAPTWVQEGQTNMLSPASKWIHLSTEQINLLLCNAEQVTQFCRQSKERRFEEGVRHSYHSDGSLQLPLTGVQKMRKVILELVETERAYVKDLTCLIQRYLEPLKEETFLSNEDIELLFGNIQELVQFQKHFLKNLEETIDMEPHFDHYTELASFKNVIFAVSGSFLDYANHFKLYSSFCASHSKAQKVLNPDANSPLRNFLKARNPKQQHSATLQSYLIKPIQRILKYPLLLSQLKSLTTQNTAEYNHLSEALKGMESVAAHINEMQKIYEEYGEFFENLLKLYRDSYPEKMTLDISIGDLLMHRQIEWLNAADVLGRPRKSMQYVTVCFVFKAGVAILCKEMFKQKKKYKASAGGSTRKAPPLENPEVTRLETIIPVQELQIRTRATHDIQDHLVWELLHLKSVKDGRPEVLYHIGCSSIEAKTEFLRSIRLIIQAHIHRSNAKMSKTDTSTRNSSFPSSNSWAQSRDHRQSNRDSWHVGDARKTQARHYDELDASYHSISQNSLDSHSSAGSAKLLHSSHSPLDYSQSQSPSSSIGKFASPVWRPRQCLPPAQFREERTLQSTSKELSNSLILVPQNACTEEDTEC